ncbi:hypothetical protein Avbf_17248 [Armadillidium vulgare]|nr:hypothetical protein Avbf_17248 [Armadillidium vulgare]
MDEHAEGGQERGRKHHGKCMKEIFDFLKNLEGNIAGPIRCCFAKAVGFSEVNSDGSINEEGFLTHLQERITDQAILGIYKTVMPKCRPQGANCNVAFSYSFANN